MNEELKQALMDLLGGRFAEAGAGAVVSPQNERELIAVLRLLRERGGRVGDGLEVSRRHFASVGAVEFKSALVTVGAGVKLERLEQELRLKDLSLGPLSPGMRAADVAEFVEGPYAGLRAVPGGRLEPMPIALTAIMADGLRYVSWPTPRSAAGPDLDALLWGGEGRFGLLTEATLRLFPRPRAERVAVYSFAGPSALIAALRGAVAGGCLLRRAQVAMRGGRTLLSCELIGSAEGVERDLSTLAHEVFAAGGRSSGVDPGLLAQDGAAERELTWTDLERVLAAGGSASLYRASLETLIAAGTIQAGESLGRGGWANHEALELALKAADPERILGGGA